MDSIVGVFLVLLIIFLSALFYFIPWFIALARKHNNVVAIFFLNLFLGWTLIGWVGALIWACIQNDKKAIWDRTIQLRIFHEWMRRAGASCIFKRLKTRPERCYFSSKIHLNWWVTHILLLGISLDMWLLRTKSFWSHKGLTVFRLRKCDRLAVKIISFVTPRTVEIFKSRYFP